MRFCDILSRYPASTSSHALPATAETEQRLSEEECSSLATGLITEMRHWFEAASAQRQLLSAFVESDGCERVVSDMLMAVRSTAPASKAPAALAAIRVNFADALEIFYGKPESERGPDWRRECVVQHIQSWVNTLLQLCRHVSPLLQTQLHFCNILCRIHHYKLNGMYPDLPESWKRALVFTEEATYSITWHAASLFICDSILKRGGSNNATVVDAFACVGGDTAHFVRRFRQVHAIELDPAKIPVLRHNLRVCLNCPHRPEEAVPPPNDMLQLPAHLRIHVGDCRAVIPTLELVPPTPLLPPQPRISHS